MSLAELELQRLKMLIPSQRRWVDAHVQVGVPDLRTIPTDEVRRLFPRGGGGGPQGVNMAALLRTLVWQTWLLVAAGEEEPMRGNLRSFWYRVVEPFCLRHGLLEPEEGPNLLSFLQDNAIPELVPEEELDHPSSLWLGEGGAHATYVLGAMGRILDQFVKLQFFTFQEPFEFRDPRENFHALGAGAASILFFTEKEGLWWLAQEIERKYRISVMASHGEPGLLTLEFFCDQIRHRKIKKLYVGALTDYDPWGYAIAENLRRKFELPVFDFEVHLRRLTSLKLFTPERITYSRRDLRHVSARKKAQVDDWVRLTGGVNGEPYGMHVDNAEIPLIRQQVEAWVKEVDHSSHKAPPPPAVPSGTPTPT